MRRLALFIVGDIFVQVMQITLGKRTLLPVVREYISYLHIFPAFQRKSNNIGTVQIAAEYTGTNRVTVQSYEEIEKSGAVGNYYTFGTVLGAIQFFGEKE